MNKIEATLPLMLEEYPPPSRNEVSNRIGCHRLTLRKHFPELFSLIEKRFSNYNADLYDKEKIKSSIIAAKKENPPCSLNSVAKRLGCSKGLLRLLFPKDCQVIANRYVESQKVFVDVEDTRAKLVALQGEIPPLSIGQCAKRLGCSRDNLSEYFPEITHAIGIKYYKYRQKQAIRRRKRRYKIILRTIAALEAESIMPNAYNVNKRLPKLKGLSYMEVAAVLHQRIK
jgi:AraC-like DNA-binding protein